MNVLHLTFASSPQNVTSSSTVSVAFRPTSSTPAGDCDVCHFGCGICNSPNATPAAVTSAAAWAVVAGAATANEAGAVIPALAMGPCSKACLSRSKVVTAFGISGPNTKAGRCPARPPGSAKAAPSAWRSLVNMAASCETTLASSVTRASNTMESALVFREKAISWKEASAAPATAVAEPVFGFKYTASSWNDFGGSLTVAPAEKATVESWYTASSR
mmetsp:Transcript_73411/g.203858  ORF Transcript_73411/g.203858 Transcript_73411/m.203858 type:complete len:217 (-) Transcript_73411:267-917(-)